MKTLLLVPLMIACLLAGSISIAQAAKDEVIGSTLSVKYKEPRANDPYGRSEFKGTVGPRKCAKKREVKIKGYGEEATNRKGRFKFTLDADADPGRYKVKVLPKELKNDKTCAKVKATLRVTDN